MRALFIAIEINLVLWLAMAGLTLALAPEDLRPMAWMGAAFAAVLQHWAYYRLYRRTQQVRS